MDIIENPFYILDASPRDGRERIVELSEERALTIDPAQCRQARSDLTIPQKRLSAEVAWLPGVETTRIRAMQLLLETSPSEVRELKYMTPVARTNLLAAGLARLSDHTPNSISEWILRIASEFEKIEVDELSEVINEERRISGFPKIKDISVVESEIRKRRQHYLQNIKFTLDKLFPERLVEAVTIAVNSATNNGEKPCPRLMVDVVDVYEKEAQEFFEKEENNINIMIDRIQQAANMGRPDSILAPMIDELILIVKNWDMLAQPIQVTRKSQGLDHDSSHRIAILVRDLAIHIFKKHQKPNFSLQLTNMLQEVFAEVGKVAEWIAEDIHDLNKIDEQIQNTNKPRGEINRVIYETDVGFVFKTKLLISSENIEWGERKMALSSITRMRWGGHIKNGRRAYFLGCGNDSEYMPIEMKNKIIYDNCIKYLSKPVFARLFIKYLKGWRDGKEYSFGSAIISNHGVRWTREALFSRNEEIFYPWTKIETWRGNDTFHIGKRDSRQPSVAFSYIYHDNVNILEFAIRQMREEGGSTLSSSLKI